MSDKLSLSTKIFAYNENGSNVIAQNTFTDVLNYGVIGIDHDTHESGSLLVTKTTYTLSKQSISGRMKLVKDKEGTQLLRVWFKGPGDTRYLNPLLSVTTSGNITWGVVVVEEADPEDGYLVITRENPPDDIMMDLPEFIDLDNFDRTGSLKPGILYNNPADGTNNYHQRHESAEPFPLVIGVTLASLLSRNSTRSSPRDAPTQAGRINQANLDEPQHGKSGNYDQDVVLNGDPRSSSFAQHRASLIGLQEM